MLTNLDYLCAKFGQKIGNALNKVALQKAHGILREDGVYAMFLWLETQNLDRSKIIELLNQEELKKNFFNGKKKFSTEFPKFYEDLQNVAKDLDKLIFLKKLLERTLVYALYHAKTTK